MRSGIAQKLATTYLIIILATIVSGGFCFYAVKINQRAYSEMRYVTLPSLESIKEMKQLMLEIKKNSNSWVFLPNNKDKVHLLQIISTTYPQKETELKQNSAKWANKGELDLFDKIIKNNSLIIDSVNEIIALLKQDEDYANDQIVDKASNLYTVISKLVSSNDKLLSSLIETKEHNLEVKQISNNDLFYYLYIVIAITIFVVIAVSIFSLWYSIKNIVSPILELNKEIIQLGKGNVNEIPAIKRPDEIGQMHNSISNMIHGILQKIKFSEQIGTGIYNINFNLLSQDDKLGIALITMRNNLKKSNEALLQQGERLLEAQKLAKIGNFLIDNKTGEFQSSTTLDDILGIDSTFKKTNKNWHLLILPEYRSLIIEKELEAINSKKRFVENFVIKRHCDGIEKWVEVIGEHKYDDNGQPLSMYGTLQDITESKTLEIELNNSYKVATEQNRRLLNFSYIVSHNLRMHAVNIHSLLKLLDESETEEEKNEIIVLLHKASELLDETMHHLNDVVAMQNSHSVATELLNLNKHINHAIDILQTQIQNKSATIVNNVPDDFSIVYNPAYLDSIILNFISNAIKYSHPDRPPYVTIDCYKENNFAENSRWVLQIADNGIGIDLNRNGHKLFGMYKTFHNNKDAKGIGLFLTKYQIEAMGGNVEVSSELNKGTTFKIFIKQQ